MEGMVDRHQKYVIRQVKKATKSSTHILLMYNKMVQFCSQSANVVILIFCQLFVILLLPRKCFVWCKGMIAHTDLIDLC